MTPAKLEAKTTASVTGTTPAEQWAHTAQPATAAQAQNKDSSKVDLVELAAETSESLVDAATAPEVSLLELTAKGVGNLAVDAADLAGTVVDATLDATGSAIGALGDVLGGLFS